MVVASHHMTAPPAHVEARLSETMVPVMCGAFCDAKPIYKTMAQRFHQYLKYDKNKLVQMRADYSQMDGV